MYDDDHKCIRSKCNWLSENRNRRVYVTDRIEALDILNDKFFVGMVFKLSELEKRPVVKGEKKYGGYGLYEPGHKVWIIDQDGSIKGERISRADFDDIEAAMIYSGGQVKGDCDLGAVRYLHRKQQPETFLKDLGIEGKMYIVPLNRSGWLPDEARIVTKEDFYELAKQNLMEYHLNQYTNCSSTYCQLVKDLKLFGVNVVKGPEYKPKVNMSYSLCNIKGYYDMESKAKRIVNRRMRIGKKLLELKKSRYPMLKYVDLRHFDKPEVVEYRKLIDSKGENK
ncbi:hypothetical protein SP40_74 [Salmonella phage 40]|nr:hypothetical protein SP40_74 [Salmonella phage 40]